MKFTQTKLKGAYIIELDKLEDDRGFFARAWCQNEFKAQGLSENIVQANVAFNNQKGILRGMHRQIHPAEEVKVVRCIRGSIFDAIVDLREDSETFKQWIGVELTADNHKALYVPEGFGHGYLTLEDN
jgi:dTDP-4-dehydrorhamnose 3,5-epimerase